MGLKNQVSILFLLTTEVRAQEVCENRDGPPGFLVPNSPYGLCGRKATLNSDAQSSGAV